MNYLGIFNVHQNHDAPVFVFFAFIKKKNAAEAGLLFLVCSLTPSPLSHRSRQAKSGITPHLLCMQLVTLVTRRIARIFFSGRRGVAKVVLKRP